MLCNPELVRMAAWACDEMEKRSFIPAGDPAAAGGAPPGGDPAAAAGAPPGMDPAAAAGGMPPGGAAPPPGGDPAAGGMPDLAGMIQQAVSQAMQQQQGMAGGAGGPGAMGPGGKPAKADINTVAMDIYQVKKMFTHLFNMNNIPLPPDILDGPNRDTTSGAAVPPGTPGSTSDPAQAAAGAGGGAGPQSAIQPIQAMQGAFPGGAPGGGGGSEKAGGDKKLEIGTSYDSDEPDYSAVTRAAHLAYLIRQIRD